MAASDTPKSPARTNPQASEIHATTGDASSAPTDQGANATPAAPPPRRAPTAGPIDIGGVEGGARIVRDDTDAGGPLVVETDDPDLNPPRVPSDPFPTDRTPEIDPPVEKK
jgi:hypothetical protein